MLSLPGAPAVAANLTHAQKHAVLEEAQAAYDRGMALRRDDPVRARQEFAAAVERFQLLADSGIANGPLFYNLGNAHLSAGDLGLAILNYRRAEQFMPGDQRLQHNLQYARSLCRTQFEISGELELLQRLWAWQHRLPLSMRFTSLVILNALLFLVLAIGVYRPGGPWRRVAIAAGIGWIVLGGSVIVDLTGWGQRPSGVLMADDVIVRKGNGAGFEPVFDQPLHSGVEFTILEQRGDWWYIRLANGDEGWITCQVADLVR
jgi:hypothetical protein